MPGELLRIEVHGPGDDGPPPEPLGEPVFRHTEPAERFAARVLGAFDALLREGGEAEYARRWGLYPFPRGPYDALAQLLRDRGLPGLSVGDGARPQFNLPQRLHPTSRGCEMQARERFFMRPHAQPARRIPDSRSLHGVFDTCVDTS
ncbi:MAG TPA: hypothetical protein VF142_14940 [Longimicrobium sp.]